MTRTITIPIKAFSINAMYCKNRSHTTTEYKDWSAAFFHKIETEDNIKALKELRGYFNPKEHAYIVDIITEVPKNTIYTKKGEMSARDFDRSNIEKPIIDLLFFPKYFKQPSPYGCENLNIDDKYIKRISSEKKASQNGGFNIIITIEIIKNGFKTR